MNPQGHNNQQPPGDHAAPAGAWNAGMDLNNAPPPLVLPAAQPAPPTWREQCKEEGWAAGDENLLRFLQQQSLVADDGTFNWALIDGMAFKMGAPEGMRIALITMAFLIDRRNVALAALRRARLQVDEQAKQVEEAKIRALRIHLDGAPVDVLRRIRVEYRAMRDRLIVMRAELGALSEEAQDYQRELQEAQRRLLAMFHGELRFGPLVDMEQYTERGNVEVLPAPLVQSAPTGPVERVASRYPATSTAFMMCLVGMPFMLIHPVNQTAHDRPEQSDRMTVQIAMMCTMFILFAHLMDLLLRRRRRRF